MGCPVARKWAVACLFGLRSQQPERPQVRHWRRWIHVSPFSTHEAQTSIGGSTRRSASKCSQNGVTQEFVQCARGPADSRAGPSHGH